MHFTGVFAEVISQVVGGEIAAGWLKAEGCFYLIQFYY